ncbi:MAG: acyl-CoA carboxylase subunit epsilon [Bifidobacteriaceae bacterium]|jgi:hypothetical protein|nr:acyl-CoA carboxylase subunit epsilon [Bifidobacteriaceae bacterium]
MTEKSLETVRGEPTVQELAALVSALLTLTAHQTPTAEPAAERSSAWSDRLRRLTGKTKNWHRAWH